jgi:hypothetical protein
MGALSKGEMIEKLEEALIPLDPHRNAAACVREVIASLREYDGEMQAHEPGWFLEGE